MGHIKKKKTKKKKTKKPNPYSVDKESDPGSFCDFSNVGQQVSGTARISNFQWECAKSHFLRLISSKACPEKW